MNIKGCKRYADTDVIREAELYLEFRNINTVAYITNSPHATVGWHLKYRLRTISPTLWSMVQDVIQINRHTPKHTRRKPI